MIILTQHYIISIDSIKNKIENLKNDTLLRKQRGDHRASLGSPDNITGPYGIKLPSEKWKKKLSNNATKMERKDKNQTTWLSITQY